MLSTLFSTVTGSGGRAFLHKIWWHVASVLGLVGIGAFCIHASVFSVLEQALTYLGLPEAIALVPLQVQTWFAERPGIAPVAGLATALSFAWHIRPWGEEDRDASMSPAGASWIIGTVVFLEIGAPGGAGLFLTCIGLLAVKCFAHGWSSVMLVMMQGMADLLHTPLTILAFFTVPAREAPALPVRVAGGAGPLRG